ncbi:MAG TPA: tyrosine-type recombinase/integrase [Polyangia bacterium]|nr:tyrosine-type recombinase/integrase [Polyangia bacterium]
MEVAPCPSSSDALTVYINAPGVSIPVPALIAAAGESAARATLEFFTARIPNAHTGKAYGRAVFAFCSWCERERVSLASLTAPTVSAYLEGLREGGNGLSLASIDLTASAIRHWLDFLTERGVLSLNPARSVRTERLVVREGKTPVFPRDEGRRLFAWLDTEAATGDLLVKRDRALMAVMLYGFVRVGAAVGMRVRDFEDEGELASLVLREKGGKERRIACHHKVREYLRAYVAAAGFDPRSKDPIFQTAPGRRPALTGETMSIDDALRAVKRRCKPAGLPSSLCNHSFRAAGITLHQENGGRLEDAQELAGHADARTTRLCIRKARRIAQAEVERVQL